MTAESAIASRVLDVLDGLGVAYEVVACDPDFADTAAFCDRYAYPIENCGNTIIVASRKEPLQYAACIVTGSSRLDVNKTVRRLMGVSRASFASAEQTMAVTGMMIGGVTPFALPADVPVYADEKLMALDYVILGSGTRSSKIRVAPDVIGRLAGAQTVAGLSMEPGPR
ncbi:MAG: YbaK/EbsC family protein [Candidatus Brocadiia bacterium]|jgi:prolyl-tRNA editing enzyme YbaK/EbsC (Cys-tRNA(Pro) deacylase)|nr:YbaK/EbsC family protein [Candidatus Brocadiia bacterium]